MVVDSRSRQHAGCSAMIGNVSVGNGIRTLVRLGSRAHHSLLLPYQETLITALIKDVDINHFRGGCDLHFMIHPRLNPFSDS